MLSFLRPHVPRTSNNNHNKTYYEDGRSWNEFNRNGYVTTQCLPPADGKPSFFYPPAHRHMYQVEYFEVVSGTGRWTLSGKHTVLSTGEKITIPRWAPHTFVNISADEPLVISANYDPEDAESEERFFRNAFGYLDDCRMAGVAPSVFQLHVFASAFDMPFVLFPGPEFLAKWLDWAAMVVMGRLVGRWVLGYSVSYPEYYDPKRK